MSNSDDKLLKELTFSLRDWKVGDRLHFPSLNAITIHEAAERIKSLLAEVRLYHELLSAVQDRYRDETRHETALRYLRDRYDRSEPQGTDNPASKEANDALDR